VHEFCLFSFYGFIAVSFFSIILNIFAQMKYRKVFELVEDLPNISLKEMFNGNIPFYMTRWFTILIQAPYLIILWLIAREVQPDPIWMTAFLMGLLGNYYIVFRKTSKVWKHM